MYPNLHGEGHYCGYNSNYGYCRNLCNAAMTDNAVNSLVPARASSCSRAGCVPSVGSAMTVDLGIDLASVRAELNSCKLRYQQDVWNVLCNRGMGGDGGQSKSWKKADSDRQASIAKLASKGETAEGTADENFLAEEGEGSFVIEENDNNRLLARRMRQWQTQPIAKSQEQDRSVSNRSRLTRQKLTDDWNNLNSISRTMLGAGLGQLPKLQYLKTRLNGSDSDSSQTSTSASSRRSQQRKQPLSSLSVSDNTFEDLRKNGAAVNDEKENADDRDIDQEFKLLSELEDDDGKFSRSSSVVGMEDSGVNNRPFVPIFCGSWGNRPGQELPNQRQQLRKQLQHRHQQKLLQQQQQQQMRPRQSSKLPKCQPLVD